MVILIGSKQNKKNVNILSSSGLMGHFRIMKTVKKGYASESYYHIESISTTPLSHKGEKNKYAQN